MDRLKDIIQALHKAEIEFTDYNNASYIDQKSPLSLYCEGRANMAACDMAHHSHCLYEIIKHETSE